MVRLHTKNQLSILPGSAYKVCVVGGGWVVVVESKLIDRLWLSFSIALAKPTNMPVFGICPLVTNGFVWLLLQKYCKFEVVSHLNAFFAIYVNYVRLSLKQNIRHFEYMFSCQLKKMSGNL